MVAASRMRRAQLAVQAGRPYARRIASVMHDLAAKVATSQDDSIPPLLKSRPVKNVGVILMTGDRGLAGALNTNVIRRALRFINTEAEVPVSVIAVGKKGRDFMLRTGRPVTAEFIGLTDKPLVRDIYPVARIATEEYLSGKVDAVYIIYTDFKNTLTQIPIVYRLLPLDASHAGEEGALPGDDSWRTLLQTFRTKIFLTLSDDFSARTASELCGREDRLKVSYNLSESGHDARFGVQP